MGGDTELS